MIYAQAHVVCGAPYVGCEKVRQTHERARVPHLNDYYLIMNMVTESLCARNVEIFTLLGVCLPFLWCLSRLFYVHVQQLTQLNIIVFCVSIDLWEQCTLCFGNSYSFLFFNSSAVIAFM